MDEVESPYHVDTLQRLSFKGETPEEALEKVIAYLKHRQGAYHAIQVIGAWKGSGTGFDYFDIDVMGVDRSCC